MIRSRPLSALAAAGVVLLAGCDGGDPSDEAPGVVAPAAFQLDGTLSAPAGAQGVQGATYNHVVQGAARVGIVTAVVGTWLAIPAAVTDAATDAEPTVEDGTWIWENEAVVHGTPLTFRLEGTPEGREVGWEMFVSADRPVDGRTYDDFVLYTATTALDGQRGDWRLFTYDAAGRRVEVLDAAFDVESATEAEVTFSIPETHPSEEARGSSVRYARDGDGRLFDWHQEPEDFRHLVEWDERTHAGAITATNYNGGQRACWDAALADAPCGATVVGN